MRIMGKKNSIYIQLLRLLSVSAIISVIVFLSLNYAGEKALDRYYYNFDYEDKMNEKYVGKFQQYISEHDITSRDADKINHWMRKQKILSISIYKDGIQVFDSAYPNQELWEEEVAIADYEWEVYYSVTFADGEAILSIMGVYAYQLYNYAQIAELLISFALYLLLVLGGIRRKIEYIMLLKDEIEILEGGSLDYKITVKGKDELSALAEGLENMRLSIHGLIESEAQMAHHNQQIVTEMSHDLRTPITSMMLYTEILKKGNYKNEDQLTEYIEKIDKKARRMKQLIDHLFEYSLVAKEENIRLEEPETFEELFYDLFSEICSYLEQKGFHVIFQVKWMKGKAQVSTNYVMRVMDNITSNIVKYAELTSPVIISSVYEGSMAGFLFENKVLPEKDKTDSSGIGMQSVQSMMEKMNGACIIEQEGQKFRVKILLPFQGA
ncbi:MAG: HAMP domain-containing histidine kinase [Lachnospiraceae bacterium]|nr:HAMP domain-containing histidine kinase [Lachnospiraceae bacterium]